MSNYYIKPFLLGCLLFFSNAIKAAPTVILHFDELGSASTNYTVYDSQNNYNGTTHRSPNIGSGLGKVCGAMDLRVSSTRDYITLDRNILHGAQDFTISSWYKGSSTNSRSLLSGARSGRDNELIFWLTNGNRFNGYINGSPGSSMTIPSITDNKWHHLVWRRAGNQSCIFTDGVKQACKSVSTKVLNIDSLILGQEQDNVGGGFSSAQDIEALIDEFMTFKSALSDTQITSIYNNQKAFKTWNGQVRTCPTPPIDSGYSDWHFDEINLNGSSGEIVDSHAGYHGTGHSVAAVPGKVCNAIDLRADSASDYAVLGAEAFDGVDDFTVSVWHKGSSANGNAILSGANSFSDNEMLFWFSTPTVFNGHLKDSALSGLSVTNIADNNWHHFVWTRKGTQSCLYIDAVAQGCQTKYTSERLDIRSLIIGQDQDSVGGSFDAGQDWEALIDELIIFRHAKTPVQITSIYNNQNSGKNWDGGARSCPGPSMSLKKTSAVLSDPVNNTNNPKRIPGAIIRYTMIAENSKSTPADNIVINDNLNNEIITLGNIVWQGNIRVSSPNINGGAWKLLTDTTGDDEGEFVNNKVIVRCGSIDDAAPCIVTYDIEVMN